MTDTQEKCVHVYELKAGDITGYVVSKKEIDEFLLPEALFCTFELARKIMKIQDKPMLSRKHLMPTITKIFSHLQDRLLELHASTQLNEWVESNYLRRVRGKFYVRGERFKELASSFESTTLSSHEYAQIQNKD